MKNSIMTGKSKNHVKRPFFNFEFMFSGAAILGILVTTGLVFSVMFYFYLDKTTSLENVPLFYMIMLTLTMSIVITFTLRKIFISPLIRLTEAMNKVAAGDFSIKLDSNFRQGDLSEVYTSFNTMVEALSQTETLSSDFVSNVSHEFKTPLSALEGYASLLQDSSLSREEQNTYIDKILFNTRRLSELVGNMLLVSRINNQKIQPKYSSYRLDEQIRYSIVALESKWAPKNIDFDINLESIEYTGVENLMGHVWTNLIDNAVKFSSQNGAIKIRLSKYGDNAEFTICNQGTLIPKEDLSRIFMKFYQCDGSRKSEGNGLGLSIVKIIVDAFAGDIIVNSSEESGTEFKVILPLDANNTTQ